MARKMKFSFLPSSSALSGILPGLTGPVPCFSGSFPMRFSRGPEDDDEGDWDSPEDEWAEDDDGAVRCPECYCLVEPGETYCPRCGAMLL